MSFPPAHWVKLEFGNLWRSDQTDQITLYEKNIFERIVIPKNTWVARCHWCWAEFSQRAYDASQYGMEMSPGSMLLMLYTVFVTRFDYQGEILVGSCLHCGTVHWLETKDLQERQL